MYDEKAILQIFADEVAFRIVEGKYDEEITNIADNLSIEEQTNMCDNIARKVLEDNIFNETLTACFKYYVNQYVLNQKEKIEFEDDYEM